MRRLIVLTAALAAGCSSSVPPTNPFDPATPPPMQAKATVRGTLTSPLLASDVGLPVTLRSGGAVVTRVDTGTGGTFILPALMPGTYQLESAPTGFVPVSVAVVLAPGQDLDLGALPLVALSGDQASALTGTASLGPGLDASGIVVTAVGRGFSTVTAADGSWRLTLIAGTYVLSFSHAGYSPASLPPVTVTAGQVLAVDGVTLAINPARLTGLVTAERAGGADAPLEGASVSLDGGGMGAVLTQPDGSFSLGNVPAGSWSLRVAAPGHVTVTQAVFDLKGGEVRALPGVRLALARGAVAGTVALADAADPMGAMVEVAGTGRVAFAGVGGAFLIDGLVEGSYQVLARKDGYASASSTVLTVSGGAVTDAGTLTLATNPGSIAGHVDGEVAGGPAVPLVGALVSLDGTTATAVTGATGDFTLPAVPAGSYLLRVEKLHYAGASVPVLGLGAGEARITSPLLLALSRGGLRGQVTLADSGDATGVVVELTGTGRAASTGASGDFTFDALLEGVYEVTARKDGYGRAVQGSVVVAAGAVADAGTLTLSRQGGGIGILEAPYTTGRVVTLQLSAVGVSHYRASEDPTLAGASWAPFAAAGDTKAFPLADADGQHTVYVQFATSAAGASPGAILSTTVVLDRQAPVQPAITVGDASGWSRASDGVVSLGLSAQDRAPVATPGAAASGLGKMQLVNGTSFAGAQWVDYNTSAVFTLSPLADGLHTISARFQDRAGNVSDPVSVDVTLDRVAPTSTTLTVSGPSTSKPGYTSTSLVTLALGASDVNAGLGGAALSVMLSNTPGFVGARYQPFAPSLSWLLTPGDGDKVVYARFMDPAGNESGSISAPIRLRTGAPSAPSLVLVEKDPRPGNGYTNNRAYGVTLSANGSPELALLAENPALTGAVAVDLTGKVLPYTPPDSLGLQLADADGPHTIWVRYYDAAGNESEPAAATVVLDRTPPLAVVPSVSPAPWTGTPSLQLTAPSAGQDDLQLAGLGLSATPSAWLAAPAGAVLTVALAGGDGAKPFTVTYRDLADNTTTVAAPAVSLDGTPPTLPASFQVRGALADGSVSASLTTTASVTLDFAGVADGGAGLKEMMTSESSTFAGAAWVPFSASAPFVLSPGEGSKVVNARFRDAVGNTSGSVSGSITVDTIGPTSPSVTVVETDGTQNGYTNLAPIKVTLNAAGTPLRALVADNPAMSGAVTVSLVGQTLPYSTPAAVLSLSAPDGLKTIYARFADAAGNLSDLATATVIYDTTPPLALPPVISPNPYAGTTAITITPPAAGQDELSVGGTGAVPRVFTAAPAGVSITATLTAIDGPKQVIVTYRDLAGNTTTLAPVTIVLDGAAPLASDFTVTGQLADGLASSTLTATTSVTLTLTGQSDGTSGIQDMLLSNDSGFAGASWQPYAASGVPWVLQPGEGLKTVYAKFRDRAGNTSGRVQGQITLHEAPPTGGSLVIENGATFTNKSALGGQTVALAIGASGAAQMRVTVDGIQGGWETYATTKQVSLTSPPDGTKVVSVLFRNDARVEGAGVSAAIVLDTAPPVLTSLALLGTLADSQTSPLYAAGPVLVARVGWSAADTGVSQVAFVESPTCTYGGGAAWQPTAPSTTVVLSSGDGPKTLCAKLRDEAGNESAPLSAIITLDTAAPPNPIFTDLVSHPTNQPTVTGTVAPLAPDSGTPLQYQCVGGQYGTSWTTCTLSGGSTLTFTLAPNQDNVLGVRTRDAAHNVSTGSLVTVTHDDVAPPPPRLTGVTTTADSLTLRWVAMADPDLVNYLVYYGNSAADLAGVGAAQGASPVSVGSGAATQYILTGLAAGTPYYVSVAAVDRAGNVSGRSAQLVAVPNVANPRLLSSLGGKPRGVAVAPGGGLAFLAENLAVLQLDVSSDTAAPVALGRVSLTNFAPLDQAPAAVACSQYGVPGHCVAVVGSTLEGDFRGAQASHRASTPLVFFPAAGGAGRVAALLPSASLFVAAGAVAGVPLLASADADRLRLYSLEDPTSPRLRAALAWSATPGLAPSITAVAAVDLSGIRALAVADGKALGFDLSALLTTGAVAVTDLGPWDGIATAGSLVRDRIDPAVCTDPPDCYNFVGPWEYLEAKDPWGTATSTVAVPLLTGGSGPSGWITGGGAIWINHAQTGHGPAYHTHVTSPGVLGPVSVLDVAAFKGLRSGAVGFPSGVEHVYAVRTEPGTLAEKLEIGAGASPTFGLPYRELTTDRFVVQGSTIYLADGALLQVVDASNPLQPAVVASTPGTPGATYRDLFQGPGLLAATWTGAGSTYGTDYFLPRGSLPPTLIGSTPGYVNSAAMVGNLLVTTGTSPAAETAVWTWTSAGAFTKQATMATWLEGLAARREVRGGVQLLAIYGVANTLPATFVSYTYNLATKALVAASAPVAIPGTFVLSGNVTVTLVEKYAIVSDEQGSWRMDLSTPTVPLAVAANGKAVAGRLALQGGYLAGLAGSGGAHGPVLATMDSGTVDGALPFTGCATPGSFAAVGAVQYSSCHRNGLLLTTLANPAGGKLLKQYGGLFSAGAYDGVSSWGLDFTGNTFRVDESVNASGTPVAPVGGLAVAQGAWLNQAGGWVFASSSSGAFASYPVAASGGLSAGGSLAFGSSGASCADGTGAVTDGRTVWVCTADGVTPISVVDPSAPVVGANIPAPYSTSTIFHDGHLWLGGYSGIFEYDVSGGTPSLLRTYPSVGEITGLAPVAGGVVNVVARAELRISTLGGQLVVYTSGLRLSNPVVAGDLLYVLENTTLLAFDLNPWLVSGAPPVRLTPTAVDAQALDKIQLWIDGPFAYGVASQSFWSGTYRAFDLR